MAPNNSTDRRGHYPIEKLTGACGAQELPDFPSQETSQIDASNIPPTSSSSAKRAPKTVDELPNGLGTYSAAISPLFMLSMAIICGVYSFKDFPLDPRVKGWFLIEWPITTVSIAVLYVLGSTVWGPRYMKGKEPLQLKKLMLVYNFFQVVFSFYMFIETGLVGWFFDYNLRCQPCDYSWDEKPVRMTRVAQWYFLSKILDFVDTAVFIARGKFNQVTNLHVIHHSCMFMSMWFGVHHTAGGHLTFLGFLNTFVHTVMYSYYLLAGLGPWIKPYLWWKRYLTKLQLIQFVAIFIHAAQLLVFPCEGVPPAAILWTLVYAFLFFALFINFYIKAYLFGTKNKSDKKKSGKAVSNGHSVTANGHSASNGHSATNGKVSTASLSSFMDNATTHRIPRSSTVVN